MKHLAARGLAVVIVSHNLTDVFAVATRITVLRLGRNVAVLDKERSPREEVVRAITLGTAATPPGEDKQASASFDLL